MKTSFLEKYLPEGFKMDITINDSKMKKMLKEVLLEMMTQDKEVFSSILAEVIEDTAMIRAIKEGKKGQYIQEEQVMQMLEEA